MAPAFPFPLPPPGSSGRWAALQQLRRPGSDPQPWLAALEAGHLDPDPDVLAALVARVDRRGARRLLTLDRAALFEALDGELMVWSAAAVTAWLEPLLELCEPTAPLAAAPQLLPLLGRCRDPRVAVRLRQALAALNPESLAASPAGTERARLLLPLLGHQRCADDLVVLLHWARQPGPLAVRRAALEGLAAGLSAWPLVPLRQGLLQLAVDLDGALASGAVNLLARLPRGRASLLGLQRRGLDPAAAAVCGRRLVALPAAPLLLLVHGRAGGLIPAELTQLARELAGRRGAPVLLQALTAGQGPEQVLAAAAPQDPAGPAAQGLVWLDPARPLVLVPLFLLPGGHVRHDLPALAAAWRRLGPLQRLPFLGAWSAWQAALAAELQELAGPGGCRRDGAPLLLHHPLEGPLGRRYLAQLERVCGARCLAAPYTAASAPEAALTSQALASAPAALPLALAANRLSDSLPAAFATPLLQRPRFRALLLELLGDLP